MSWRPRNETDRDRRNEGLVLDAFVACERLQEAIKATRWEKLSECLYEIDASLHGPEDNAPFVGWAEVKIRTFLYPTVILGVKKAIQLAMLSAHTQKPAFFLIHTPVQGVLVHRMRAIREYDMDLGGNSRGQNGDIEPLIHI